MKIARKGSPMISGGTDAAPKKFQIQASGAAFAVLSSKLYNNKPLAIIRELSCNAYDAHIAANKRDVPFNLHLPTSFEPWFSIRDFGTGLAPEAIEELYCVYFATTKNDTNDQIGAMGLGSKSPFCYADGFTVTAYWNGKKYIYSAYIEKDGTPSVKRLSEHKTTEGNGLEVNFPVKPQDCWEFENMAAVALEFFNPLPNINIGDRLQIKQTEYSVRTDVWGMRKEAHTHHTSGIRAIMGVVQYSVGNIDISRLSQDQQKLSQKPLDIFFPIGSLSVAADRERLSNDEETIETILKALTDIYTKMIEEIIGKVEACRTEWEARLLIFSLLADTSVQGMVQAAINQGKIYRKYKNFNLSKEPPYINELDYRHTMVARFVRSGGKQYAIKKNLFTKRTPDVRKRIEVEAFSNAKEMAQYDISFDVSPDTIFVYNDLKFGGEKYLHYFVQVDTDNPYRHAYLFSRYDGDTKQEDMEKEFLAILSKMGGVPVVKLSELKAKYPHLDARMPGAAPSVRRDALIQEGSGVAQYGPGWSKTWKKVFNADIPTGKKYFVWVENFTTMRPITENTIMFSSGRSFVRFIAQLRAAGCFNIDKDTIIYGIRQGTKLDKSEWIELTPYVWKRLNAVMTPEKQQELCQHFFPFGDSDYEEFIQWVYKKQSLPADSDFAKFTSLYNRTKKDKKPASEALVELIRMAESHKKFFLGKNLLNIQDVWDKMISARYPLLTLDFSSYDNRNRRVNEKLLAYVQQMDEMAQIQSAKVAATISETEEETVTI